MKTFETVVETINELKKLGYSIDFNIAFDKIMCRETAVCLNPAEFDITHVFRFEGATNPSDEDIVYAVESKDGKMKGIITSAFGVYADSVSDDMLRKLTMHT